MLAAMQSRCGYPLRELAGIRADRHSNQRQPYTVYVAPNPLLGLNYDSAYLRDFLHTISGPIILVGHSYGGAVITNAATGDKQVKALVYVYAFAPAKGQTRRQRDRPALPRCARRRSRRVHQAERLPLLHGERPSEGPGARAGSHPAAADLHRAQPKVWRPGMENHPLVGSHRNRRSCDTAGGARRHGEASARPHYVRARRAPTSP